MRILLLAKADIQGNLNLNTLLSALAGQHELDVLLSDALLAAERGNPFADACTWYDRDYILETFFPSVDAQKNDFAPLLTFNGLRRRCASLERIPHEEPQAFLEQRVRALNPDLVFCCRFDYIVREAVISQPRLGAINMHSGLLPYNGGPNASFRAMYLGEPETACTLHWITTETDGGPLLAQKRVALAYQRSLFWNRMRIYDAGIDAFLTLLPSIEKGTRPSIVQNKAQRKYYAYPNEAELSEFVAQGNVLYDPIEYYEFLRAFLPLPEVQVDIPFSPPCLPAMEAKEV